MPDVMLDVKNLEKVYVNIGAGVAGGVRDANFALEKGAFFTLLGPSGCGKTTTLRCIAGLERPDKGTIRVGNDLLFDAGLGVEVPMNLRHFGMVFQSYAIWPHMTVFENIAFPLRVAKDRSYSRQEITRMVNDALDTVSMSGFGNRSATQLSGGQQQRVALARAIVRQPRLLLLDEPLSNLDAALREEMRNELRRLQQQIGVTTVYVTHDQTEALELSDRIAVMDEGRIMQIGDPREIYFEPGNAFVARFVGTTNWLPGTFAGASEGVAKIELDGGQSVVSMLRAEMSRSQKVAVAVRPESVVLTPSNSPRADKTNRLTGRVVFAGFMGNMTRYQVDVGGGALVQAYGSPRAAYAVGDEVAVDFTFVSAAAFGSAHPTKQP